MKPAPTTSPILNEQDVKRIKSLFSSKEQKVIVDLVKQQAMVLKNNKPIGYIEKEPNQWSFRLTNPLFFAICHFSTGAKIVFQGGISYDIPKEINVDHIRNKHFEIIQSAIIFLNDAKNRFILPDVEGVEFQIPRHIMEKVALYQREISYKYVPIQ